MPLGPRAAGISKRYAPTLAIERHRCRHELAGDFCGSNDAPSAARIGPRGSGRFQNRREMKAPRIDPGLREPVGISLIAAGGCGLAFSQGDFLFVAIFAAACAVAIIEAIRRS
jgi:hypothetical protein